ncbi:GGDEF domain-containing protein [Cryptosporangium arvum]|uniref:GGDEF domain-containing protein n=1 Tax=Cryptosporangium arvum TaxID=80871 RepID=UPI0004BAA92E|nr:GGDEF domain-containing protein [Cryptosporangium arvum]
MRGPREVANGGVAAARRLTALDVIRGDRVLALAVALGAAFVVVHALLAAFGGPALRSLADALASVVLLVTFGLMLTAARGRRVRQGTGRIWLLFALSTALAAGGWAAWKGFAPIADAFFVAAAAVAIVGFLAALHPDHRSGRFWLGFDLVLVAAGAGALGWRLFLDAGLDPAVASDRTTAIVYPICGLATVLFLVPMGVFGGRRLPASLTLVGWAHVVAAACGCLTLVAGISGRFDPADPVLASAYQAPVVLLALGALTAIRSPESEGVHFPVGRDVTMLPSLVAAGAAVIGLVLVDAKTTGVQVPLLVAGLVVIGLLTRLALVVRDRTRLADQLAEALAEQQRLAITDPLTGLSNRRYFEQSLATEVVRARRNKRPLSLVVLDLDHFKQINDRHGHPAGDAALVQVGTLLQVITRDSDVVARYGGEEFVWLLPDTDEEGAAAMAERLRGTLASHPVALPSGDPLWITGSLGVASARETIDATVLTASADEAMYRAKSEGRNRVVRATAPHGSSGPGSPAAPEPGSHGGEGADRGVPDAGEPRRGRGEPGAVRR